MNKARPPAQILLHAGGHKMVVRNSHRGSQFWDRARLNSTHAVQSRRLVSCHNQTCLILGLVVLETVSPWPGLNDTWLAWIGLDFPAQAIDHVLEQHAVPFTVTTPDAAYDLAGFQHLAWTAHQQMQQAIFQIGQPGNFFILDDNRPLGWGRGQLAWLDLIHAIHRQSPGATHPSRYLGSKENRTDRFDHTLVHTGLICFDNLRFVERGEKKQDRADAGGAQLTAESDPFSLRGLEINHN